MAQAVVSIDDLEAAIYPFRTSCPALRRSRLPSWPFHFNLTLFFLFLDLRVRHLSAPTRLCFPPYQVGKLFNLHFHAITRENELSVSRRFRSRLIEHGRIFPAIDAGGSYVRDKDTRLCAVVRRVCFDTVSRIMYRLSLAAGVNSSSRLTSRPNVHDTALVIRLPFARSLARARLIKWAEKTRGTRETVTLRRRPRNEPVDDDG